MSERTIKGVVPILVTPFDPEGRVDTESLRRLVNFNIDAGVHGLGIALGSEIFTLNEVERDLVATTVVEETHGRVPVVVNTGAASTSLATFYSKRAEDLGADAVMVTPPIGLAAPSPEQTRRYYNALSSSLSIPIVVQDHASAQVAPSLLCAIASESPLVQYCKVETLPTPTRIAQAVKETEGKVGILGGAGGNFFIEEMKRGSTGTMPSCGQPGAYVRIWNLFQEGDVKGATRVFYEEVLPLNRVSSSGMNGLFHVNKQLLQRRGVIDHTVVREPTTPLDAFMQRDVDEVISRLLEVEAAVR
ncbi:MAG: dihydrodipicolinate synthase family protein [Dehalococcoidia bacterium]